MTSQAAPPNHGGNGTFWDAVALTRWGRYLSAWEQGLALKAAAMASGPGKGIDLGCGSGRWSRLLTDAGWQMTCIDVVAADLEVCRRNVPQANCILAPMDSTEIPCEANSAKILFCVEVAPVTESEWFIPEAARVLSPGGILFGVMLNEHSWRGPASRLMFHLKGNHGRYNFYNRGYPEFRQQLVKAGFELAFEEGACWGPAGRQSDSILVPVYAKLERLLGLHRLVSRSPWVGFIARKKH
jgi:ubiquinone/menaquinone biosynthesis C-methylase UbiE